MTTCLRGSFLWTFFFRRLHKTASPMTCLFSGWWQLQQWLASATVLVHARLDYSTPVVLTDRHSDICQRKPIHLYEQGPTPGQTTPIQFISILSLSQCLSPCFYLLKWFHMKTRCSQGRFNKWKIISTLSNADMAITESWGKALARVQREQIYDTTSVIYEIQIRKIRQRH